MAKKVPEYSASDHKEMSDDVKYLSDVAQEVEYEFEIAFDTSKPFGERFMAFMRGENKAGRYTGRILDFISVFLPKGYSTARQATQGILNINQTPQKMDKKWYQSKTVWSAILIALTAILQSVGLDFVGNPETMEAIYSVMYPLAGAFGLYGLRDAIGKKIGKEE